MESKTPKLCSCGRRLEGPLVDYLTYHERKVKAVKCVWCKQFNEMPEVDYTGRDWKNTELTGYVRHE